MTTAHSPELFWLLAVTALTMSLWIPHILALVWENGLVRALADGEHEVSNPDAAVRLNAAWARRAMRGHWNAIENLAPFAALALMVHVTESGDAVTGTLCAAFFFIRAAHFVFYAFGLPFVRTFAFFAGYGCVAGLAAHLSVA